MEAQLVSIQDTLYAVMFVLGAILVLTISVLFFTTRETEDAANSEINDSGSDEDLPAMPETTGKMVLRKRTIHPPGTPESILYRERKAKDERGDDA